MVLCVTNSALAGDWYVGAQAGLTWPQKLESVQAEGGTSNTSTTDLDLQHSIVYGGKVGGYFPGSLQWLGVEAEIFNTNPNLKQQTVTTTVSGTPTTGTLTGAHLRVTTVAVNALVRYPGKQIQPYIGAGLGIFWTRLSNATGSNTETSPGFNGLVGLRYRFMETVSFFTEYKFNYSVIKFTDTIPGAGNIRLQGNYTTHQFVGGISIHFDGPS